MKGGRPRVSTGLERLLREPRRLRGQRLGLVANPTAVTSDLDHASLATTSTYLRKLEGSDDPFGPRLAEMLLGPDGDTTAG